MKNFSMLRSTLAALSAVLSLSTMATAAPDRFSLLLGSKHIGASGFEEVNPGVFLTWERQFDFSFGLYRNSYGRPAVAGVVAYPLYQRGTFQLAVFGGTALYPVEGRRFRAHLGDFVPVAGVQVRLGKAFVQVIPSDGRPVQAIVSFGLSFSLGKSP